MDPVQSLLREAADLERSLRADTQTWASRVEGLFSSLLEASGGFEAEAGSTMAAFNPHVIGKAFAAMFLIQGIAGKGLPHINGQDPLQWVANWKADPKNHGNWGGMVSKLAAVLPSGYGNELAAAVLGAAAAVVGRGKAEDLVQDAYMHFFTGAGEKLTGSSESALKYVKNWIEWRGSQRATKDRRDKSITKGPGTEDEGMELDLIDETPNLDVLLMKGHSDPLYKKLWDIIFTDPKLKGELEKIHPDALQYLHIVAHASGKIPDTQILGVNAKREIIGDSMLAHPFVGGGKDRMYPALWNTKKQAIFKTILHHFAHHGEHEHEVREHMHMAYDYDRRASDSKKKLEETWGHGSMATIYQYTSGPKSGKFVVEHGKKTEDAHSLADARKKSDEMVKHAAV